MSPQSKSKFDPKKKKSQVSVPSALPPPIRSSASGCPSQSGHTHYTPGWLWCCMEAYGEVGQVCHSSMVWIGYQTLGASATHCLCEIRVFRTAVLTKCFVFRTEFWGKLEPARLQKKKSEIWVYKLDSGITSWGRRKRAPL